ncbi:MAG TPA: RNA polymerase sigma factor [Polyangiaceae bacterium]|nr:RNA polymerase sigma factor [Polyangiaceae bacterium]
MQATRDAFTLRAVTGGADALDWSRFYDEHFDFVWRSLRRLGVPEAALDDAAQEVFLVAFRRHHEFAGRSSVRTWLFGIAWNRTRELLRGARRRPEEPLPDTLPHAAGVDQEQAAIERQALAFAYRVLAELTPERRALLVMAEVEEMTAAEIAEVLGVPLNTVYSRLRLARRDFEAALKRCRARDERRPR